MSINNCVRLIGNVGQEPEIRSTNGGTRVAQISLATNDKWRDKNTGQQIAVEGKLQTRKWTDNNGQDRWTTEVVISAFDGGIQLLGSNGSGRPPPVEDAGAYGSQPSYAARHDNPGAVGSGRHRSDDLDDEIPF